MYTFSPFLSPATQKSDHATSIGYVIAIKSEMEMKDMHTKKWTNLSPPLLNPRRMCCCLEQIGRSPGSCFLQMMAFPFFTVAYSSFVSTYSCGDSFGLR